MCTLPLTGMQVFSYPGIAVCEPMTEEMNGTGEFTSGSGSEMMSNDTIEKKNTTCVRCGA